HFAAPAIVGSVDKEARRSFGKRSLLTAFVGARQKVFAQSPGREHKSPLLARAVEADVHIVRAAIVIIVDDICSEVAIVGGKSEGLRSPGRLILWVYNLDGCPGARSRIGRQMQVAPVDGVLGAEARLRAARRCRLRPSSA